MCPSYMVTREEMHSTRGRARLLFEMMNGEVLDEGWKSPAVKEALDLCLSCKGCKGDCPVNVDMATYKSEFLAHFYEGRLRPRHAFAFGWIHIWSRLASLAPTLANFVTQTPGLSVIAKWMAGMDQRRSIPPFAPQSFKQWFHSHEPKNPHGEPVILFADTFNNYYHVETAKAAVEVLEDAGFRVEVPMQDMCCGRPLYDYGFLNMARRWAEDIIEKLRPQIQAGIPIVVLEPSCWAVFKDELTNILPPRNEDAIRLQKLVYTFGDFLKKRAPHYRVPRLARKALLHAHCHQHALDVLNDKVYGDLHAEKEVLKQMGVEFDQPHAGCCGMAGAFGYEQGDHYDVSLGAGERVLLPKVREAEDQKVVIADGFSCRSQIEQETDRTALHLAQVVQLAMRHGPTGPPGRPEDQLLRERKAAQTRAALRTTAFLAAGALIGSALIWKMRQRERSATQRIRHAVRPVARGARRVKEMMY